MTKQYWWMVFKRWVIAIGVVFVAGVLFDHFANEKYSRTGLMAGVWALALYACAGVVFSVVNFAAWITYMGVFSGTDMSDSMVQEMRALKLPPPRQQDYKNFNYLAAIADDQAEPADDRVKAALFLATYQGVMKNTFFKAIVVGKALDEAVVRYAAEAPPRSLR